MASSSFPGKAGVVVAPDDANAMEQLTHGVLDDLLYNVIHDLLIKVHRDEKMARANSAAIRVESLALQSSDAALDSIKPDVRVETDAAIFEEGRVLLKGNPLKTTHEIVCPRCKLPRLLYPTEGKGARKPDPNTEYCKKHPYIEKPGYDIYGQTWVAPGPGRGKKKKDMKTDADTPGTPTADGTTSAKDRPPNVLSFPSATCSKCKRCILVTRLNNHMGSCIGNSGRNASRAAAQKISNGSGGSQKDDNTPPGSQKGTPMPPSRAASPRKRDGDEYDEDVDESDVTNPKKKLKAASAAAAAAAAGLGKKVILKAKGPKKDKVKGNSQLSVEHKAEDMGDKKSPVVKKASLEAPAKKANVKRSLSPAKKTKMHAKPPLSSPAPRNGSGHGHGGEHEPGSESSGTLSSPRQ